MWLLCNPAVVPGRVVSQAAADDGEFDRLPVHCPNGPGQVTGTMPKSVIKRVVAITALTFLTWLGLAAIFPDDRLDLHETIFVWAAIAFVLLMFRSILRFAARYRARQSKARRNRAAR